MYLSLLIFALMCASLTNTVSWVSGYLEFEVPLGVSSSNIPRALSGFGFEERLLDAAKAAKAAPGRRLQATVTVQPEIHMSLQYMNRVANFPLWYSQNLAWSTETFNIADYINDINYASSSLPTSRWYGAKQISAGIFADTFGLIVVAALVQFCVWLSMVLLSYEAPGIPFAATVQFSKAGSAVSAFFCCVALILFGSSGIKQEICSAYDPDALTNGVGKGCDYAEGFACIVCAAIFNVVLAGLMYKVVPEHKPAAYAFAGGDSASKLAVGGYADVGSSRGGGGSSGSESAISFQQSTAL